MRFNHRGTQFVLREDVSADRPKELLLRLEAELSGVTVGFLHRTTSSPTWKVMDEGGEPIDFVLPSSRSTLDERMLVAAHRCIDSYLVRHTGSDMTSSEIGAVLDAYMEVCSEILDTETLNTIHKKVSHRLKMGTGHVKTTD